MKQDLTNENGFNKSYERSMNHNYMILSKCNFFDTAVSNSDFRTRMLLENNIKGLLPVSFRQINGEDRYYYEINSLQAFDRLYDNKEMRYTPYPCGTHSQRQEARAGSWWLSDQGSRCTRCVFISSDSH